MLDHKLNQDKPKKQKSMLDTLLDEWDLNYVQFSKHMGISRNTLLQYRRGIRELRLNWEQIQKLELLLKRVDKTFNDLPPDWFRDKE